MGAVGILFEQGSSRGISIKTERTERTFADSVANQVRTSLSSIDALARYSNELLQFQCDFFSAALEKEKKLSLFFLPGRLPESTWRKSFSNCTISRLSEPLGAQVPVQPMGHPLKLYSFPAISLSTL